MRARIAISIALATSTLLVGLTGYEAVRRTTNVITYSEANLLQDSWNDYKRRDWNFETGRVIDHKNGNTSTSEGQSYALLRAVWINDKSAFDTTLRWTLETLQHSNDHLFSWLFGKRSDGELWIRYDAGGGNAATDADTDIALALILAYSRWHDRTYLDEAREIVRDIWRYEVVDVGGIPYVVANDVERNSQQSLLINPSYFEPYAYRLFARIDPEHNWCGVVRSSYLLLDRTLDAPLHSTVSAGLPPDWIRLDRKTGQLLDSPGAQKTWEFGVDALRVPWRLAVDWEWNHAPEALRALKRMSVLSSFWNRDRELFARYGHDGSPHARYESAAMYGASLGYFLTVDPAAANAIYRAKIAGRFQHSLRSWQQPYYEENWLWFGAAMKQGLIRDLGASHTLQSFEADQLHGSSTYGN